MELPGPGGLLSTATMAVLVRALAGEMTGHLGYANHGTAGRGSGDGRNGTFGPPIVRKDPTALKGFTERIFALWARGMTTCDIRARLWEAEAPRCRRA